MNGNNNSEQPVGSITKNAIEELRVGLSEYRGHHLINCRIWANYDSPLEEKRPTKKGFALAVAKLPELIAALQEAEQQARVQGLLGERDEAA